MRNHLIALSVSLVMLKMGRMGWLLLLLLAVGSVQAQQTASSPVAASQAVPSVEKLLPQLHDYARQYRTNLPSLSCDESVTSQRVKKGVVRREMKIESTLRVVRMDTGPEPFSERVHFNTVDGHAVPPRVEIPFYIQGGFANAMGFMGRETATACYEYLVSTLDEGKTLRLDIAVRPNNTDAACKEVPEGYRKSALIDAASGRITYVERTMSAKAAREKKDVFFATMQYGPQQMGDEMLWLPIKMTAHDDKEEGRISVTYSNYHRYTAKVTIAPTVVPTGVVLNRSAGISAK